MKKITELHRLGFGLGIRVMLIYFRRLFRPASDQEISYLTYYTILIQCNFRHLEEIGDMFKVVTSSNVPLFVRKPPSSDLQVLKQIWQDFEYAGAVELVRKYIKNEAVTIIDAGANVGYSSVYLYSKLAKEYTPSIIAVEPSNANADMIKLNFDLNHVKNYSIEKAGLFNKECFLNILTDFRDGKDWSLRVEESTVKTDLRSVELVGLMQKHKWNAIDFLKIDIEGAERYLFEDEGYSKSFLSRTKIISIEIHDEYQIRERILNALAHNNFTFEETGEIVIGINNSLVQN